MARLGSVGRSEKRARELGYVAVWEARFLAVIGFPTQEDAAFDEVPALVQSSPSQRATPSAVAGWWAGCYVPPTWSVEKINLDVEIRKKIHRKSLVDICKDVKEVKRMLQELFLYSPGTKHSIDIRRMDLERALIGLSKEKRITKLTLWKDLVFLRRELREILFEYSALQRISELVENGGKNDVAG